MVCIHQSCPFTEAAVFLPRVRFCSDLHRLGLWFRFGLRNYSFLAKLMLPAHAVEFWNKIDWLPKRGKLENLKFWTLALETKTIVWTAWLRHCEQAWHQWYKYGFWWLSPPSLDFVSCLWWASSLNFFKKSSLRGGIPLKKQKYLTKLKD